MALRRAFHIPAGNPRLTIDETNRILRQFQSSWKVPSNQLIKRIDTSSLLSSGEDETFEKNLPNNSGIFLGVLDGHWSRDCARLVKYSLPQLIKRLIAKKGSIDMNDLGNAFQLLDSEILKIPWKALPELDTNIQAVKALSREKKLAILRKCIPALAGSCALVSHIKDNSLRIAHAGDCRAVMGSFDSEEKAWKLRAMTEDHQPSNLRELARLHSEHPGEDDTVAFNRGEGPIRVLGGLMPSRAFGDARYKWTLEEQDKIDALFERDNVVDSYAWLRPMNLFTPPYITATPEVLQYSISSTNDRFLVMATDGLFDILSNRDVVRIISNYIRFESENKIENAATYLIRHAVEMGQNQEFLSRMLTLEPNIARRYRDDISVQVIFFKSSDVVEYGNELEEI